jgi:hypothetical protein
LLVLSLLLLEHPTRVVVAVAVGQVQTLVLLLVAQVS